MRHKWFPFEGGTIATGANTRIFQISLTDWQTDKPFWKYLPPQKDTQQLDINKQHNNGIIHITNVKPSSIRGVVHFLANIPCIPSGCPWKPIYTYPYNMLIINYLIRTVIRTNELKNKRYNDTTENYFATTWRWALEAAFESPRR